MTTPPIIEIKNLTTQFDGNWVHHGINLSIRPGEIFAVVGGSGAGKSVLLREIIMLQPPTSGSISVFGQDLTTASLWQLIATQKRWGVLFQQGALFSSLTLLENVAFPLKEHTDLDAKSINELAMLKILATGLPESAATKYPSELSGGMQKRAALARAMALDPELLFLDEPTAGLDPDSAAALDDLVLTLRNTLNLTVVMITHDLDSLWQIADRVAFLGEGRVLGIGAMSQLVANPHPLIHDYFSGPRGRTAQKLYQDKK